MTTLACRCNSYSRIGTSQFVASRKWATLCDVPLKNPVSYPYHTPVAGASARLLIFTVFYDSHHTSDSFTAPPRLRPKETYRKFPIKKAFTNISASFAILIRPPAFLLSKLQWIPRQDRSRDSDPGMVPTRTYTFPTFTFDYALLEM